LFRRETSTNNLAGMEAGWQALGEAQYLLQPLIDEHDFGC
jgi:hypothetical protein